MSTIRLDYHGEGPVPAGLLGMARDLTASARDLARLFVAHGFNTRQAVARLRQEYLDRGIARERLELEEGSFHLAFDDPRAGLYLLEMAMEELGAESGTTGAEAP